MKHRIIFAVLMSFTLSLIMSAWITFLNIGTQPGFISIWMHACMVVSMACRRADRVYQRPLYP